MSSQASKAKCAHTLRVIDCNPGDPVHNLSHFESAWDECIELQVQDKETWVGQTLAMLMQLHRYEIAVADVHGSPVGACVVAADPWDGHVGPCWAVVTQYVHPAHRNRGVSGMLMREALRIARSHGAKAFAFTHRTGPWRYQTIYRKLK